MQANKSIALFIPSFHPGGAKTSLFNIGEYLADKGYNVDILVRTTEGGFSLKLPDNVSVVNLNSGNLISAFPGIIKYLKSSNVDKFLSTNLQPNAVSALAKYTSRSNKELIVRHNTNMFMEDYNGLKSKTIPHILKNQYNKDHVDKIITISDGLKTNLVNKANINESKIHTIHNPSIKSVSSIEQMAETPPNHDWFPNNDTPIILGAGRLEKQKDFSTLINSFLKAKDSIDARLIIIGEGKQRERLERLVRELGIQESVSFPGYVDNPYSYMLRSDVFVLSSAWEGFGNVLVEAMATGTTVVSTNCVSGPSEILKGGKYGRLTPVGNSHELAENIIGAINNPHNSKDLKKRASEFNINKKGEEYRKFIFMSS